MNAQRLVGCWVCGAGTKITVCPSVRSHSFANHPKTISAKVLFPVSRRRYTLASKQVPSYKPNETSHVEGCATHIGSQACCFRRCVQEKLRQRIPVRTFEPVSYGILFVRQPTPMEVAVATRKEATTSLWEP